MKKFLESFAKHVSLAQRDVPVNVLQSMAKTRSIENSFGNALFRSKITARSSKFTDLVDDYNRGDIIQGLLMSETAKDYLLVKVRVGSICQPFYATALIHRKHANLAWMLSENFWLSDHSIEDTQIWSFDNPLSTRREVWVDPEERCTIVLGIDYYGELKMSVLRMAMEIMKKDRRGLGLHAGSKLFLLQQGSRGVLVFGLSGTGKTTIVCHDHHDSLKETERIVMLQDDVNFLTEDCIAFGSENRFYVKCDQCPEHKSITAAVKCSDTIMENVATDVTGQVKFKYFDHTRNTRALINRRNLKGTSDSVDLGKVDIIIFNTRRPEVPIISKLSTPEQIAAYYALGESIITSAEDPKRVGEPKRQIGFDPFIVDTPGENINRFCDIIKRSPGIEAYVVNTGYIETEKKDITVEVTVHVIEQALRNRIEWRYDPYLKVHVPTKIHGTSSKYLRFMTPSNAYGHTAYRQITDDLRASRLEYLSAIKGLDLRIINSV